MKNFIVRLLYCYWLKYIKFSVVKLFNNLTIQQYTKNDFNFLTLKMYFCGFQTFLGIMKN